MAKTLKWTPEKLEELVTLYNGGASVAGIAEVYKVSRIRIYQLLKQAGVVVRGKQANLGPQTAAAIINIEENINAD